MGETDPGSPTWKFTQYVDEALPLRRLLCETRRTRLVLPSLARLSSLFTTRLFTFQIGTVVISPTDRPSVRL